MVSAQILSIILFHKLSWSVNVDDDSSSHRVIAYPHVTALSKVRHALLLLQFFSSVPSNMRGPLLLGCHGSVKQFEWLITRWGKFKADLGRSRIPIVDGAREEGKHQF